MRTPKSRIRRRIVKTIAAYCPTVAITVEPSANTASKTANACTGQVSPASWVVHRPEVDDRDAIVHIAQRLAR